MAEISEDARAIAAAGLVQAFVAARTYTAHRAPDMPDLLELHRMFFDSIGTWGRAADDEPPPID